MLAGSGRPRKACDLCQRQRVRCSNDRPACKRCAKSGRDCVYGNAAPHRLRATTTTSPNNSTQQAGAISTSPVATGQPLQARNRHDAISDTSGSLAWSIPRARSPEKNLLGIPSSLVATLVDVYYSHVYNASLMVHRASFAQELKSGTASPAMVLSICALASVFYRDSKDNPSLREHGFSIDWAERAGKLAFESVETPKQDNIVAFLNLLLFWYSQGSWQRSFIHKANAVHIAHILGLGDERIGKERLFESELRRRRFWACYLVDCHASESPWSIFTARPVADLSLPWHEKDFEAGCLSQPPISLSCGKSNGGLWSEVVKAMSIWSAVHSLIKSPNGDMASQVAAIQALDARIAEWWENVPHRLKLSSEVIEITDKESLPKLLLITVVYHQSLCALHASIVPLFSWSSNDGGDKWGFSRRLSAQVAFDHACAASALFALFSESHDPSTASSFVAYAAYCSCAIQIPFLWSSDLQLRERVRFNIRTNVGNIRTMAKYWRFGAMLEIYVHCLYRMHAKNPIVLEAEPQYLKPHTLRGFRVTALNARESVLGHNGILWVRGEGCVKQGEEVTDLGADNNDHGAGNSTSTSTMQESQPVVDTTSSGLWSQIQPEPPVAVDRQHSTSMPETSNLSTTEAAIQDTNFFYPFLEPDRLNMFLDGELLNFNTVDDVGFNLDDFNDYLAGQGLQEDGC